jgi:hypothetical protein
VDLIEIKWGYGLGYIWLRIEASRGSFAYGNEPSDSIKCWKFFEW